VDPSSYWDLSRPGERPERTAYFVLDSLLRSRIECGFESNSTRYDEDVNVYLVNLLSSLVASPDFGAHAADCDLDVFEQVRDSSDPRFKSLVYRTNADRLLLYTGIFTQSPYTEEKGQRVFEHSTRERIGRGKAYYHYASTLHERLPAASPAVARVLRHLSEDFERYVDVLFHMRGEYFHLYERIKEEQLMALQGEFFKSSPRGKEQGDVKTLRDEFLDAYWLWHQKPDPTTRNALIEAVKRLRAADPSFDFQFPEE
jgi:hypothetical protein